MRVQVKLMSDLRKYLRGRPEPLLVELTEEWTVASVIKALDISEEEEIIVGINGKLGFPETPLADGDKLMLITPMAGG